MSNKILVRYYNTHFYPTAQQIRVFRTTINEILGSAAGYCDFVHRQLYSTAIIKYTHSSKQIRVISFILYLSGFD